ncbi:MAG TPA: hypothetical protein VF784_10975 [Anaerolineales bacterium]
MRSVALVLTLCFLLVADIACGHPKIASGCESLLHDVSKDEINTDLRISASANINTFQLGEDVNLVLDDNSKNLIEVAPGKDLRIFRQADNTWSEVANQIDYSGRIERLSFPTSDNPGGGMLNAAFAIPQANGSVQVCIVLRGVKDPDGNRIPVGAYVEMTMHP